MKVCSLIDKNGHFNHDCLFVVSSCLLEQTGRLSTHIHTHTVEGADQPETRASSDALKQRQKKTNTNTNYKYNSPGGTEKPPPRRLVDGKYCRLLRGVQISAASGATSLSVTFRFIFFPFYFLSLSHLLAFLVSQCEQVSSRVECIR